MNSGLNMKVICEWWERLKKQDRVETRIKSFPFFYKQNYSSEMTTCKFQDHKYNIYENLVSAHFCLARGEDVESVVSGGSLTLALNFKRPFWRKNIFVISSLGSACRQILRWFQVSLKRFSDCTNSHIDKFTVQSCSCCKHFQTQQSTGEYFQTTESAVNSDHRLRFIHCIVLQSSSESNAQICTLNSDKVKESYATP